MTREITVTMSGSREAILRAIRSLPEGIARGTGPLAGVGQAFASKIAATFFRLVSDDFEVKSLGGRGVSGDIWAPNSPATLAYKKGEKSERMGSGVSPNNRQGGPGAHGGALSRLPGSGELDKAMLSIWWQAYNKRKWQLVNQQTGRITVPKGTGKKASEIRRQLLSVSITREIKSRAAAFAWIAVKDIGAKRLIDTVGQRSHKILVDRTHRLKNSLRPSSDAQSIGYGGTYAAGPSQIATKAGTRMVLGSDVIYAVRQHKKRPLWPKTIPEQWLQSLGQAGMDALATLETGIKNL